MRRNPAKGLPVRELPTRRPPIPTNRWRAGTWSFRAVPTTSPSSTCARARSHACGWPGSPRQSSELEAFDLIEARLSTDPERDDLAHPEAVSINGIPRSGRLCSKAPGQAPPAGLWSLPTSATCSGSQARLPPTGSFVACGRLWLWSLPRSGPLLFRRQTDDTTWARFGWSRSDNWLPVEDDRAISCLWAAGRDKLTGKDLAAAIGFRPRYLLVALTPPRGPATATRRSSPCSRGPELTEGLRQRGRHRQVSALQVSDAAQ